MSKTNVAALDIPYPTMIKTCHPIFLFVIMGALIAVVGFYQSWSIALAILQLCLISSIMALGVNIQWGYAGLFNAGIMGFAALGGLAAVLVSVPPVKEAWAAGGVNIVLAAVSGLATIGAVLFVRARIERPFRILAITPIIIIGFLVVRWFFDPAVEAIEGYNAAHYGFLGGAGLPIMFSWILGGAFAAGAAWLVGKTVLRLRSDYLAIATLGISEIVIAVLKNEDWLARGVKNVTGLPRPVPYEVNLQKVQWFLDLTANLGADAVSASSIFVKICYIFLFLLVLAALMWLANTALASPWGRMMRAIRDNRDAAEAMGKDVTSRHLQVFILGSVVVGIAGAMLTTLEGQFTPGSYQPLRFTFLIWVMVIVGGSGNNWGAVLGGFIIWFIWIEAEPVSLWLMGFATSSLDTDSPIRNHLIESAPHFRLFLMGAILLLVLRFRPRGLIPEE